MEDSCRARRAVTLSLHQMHGWLPCFVQAQLQSSRYTSAPRVIHGQTPSDVARRENLQPLRAWHPEESLKHVQLQTPQGHSVHYGHHAIKSFRAGSKVNMHLHHEDSINHPANTCHSSLPQVRSN